MGELADEHGCIRRVLVAMMVADGNVDPDEIATIRDIYRKMTGLEVGADELLAQAEHMRAHGLTISSCLGSLCDGLDDEAKHRVLAAAYQVAAADGFVLEEEDQLLANVAGALGLTHAEYRAALADFTRGG
jgi:tellurite resistance protein